MDRWIGKVAVVTGASSGIGASIAEELVKVGVLVVGLARRFERLEQLSSKLKDAKGKFHPRKCDLRKKDELLDALKWVNDELGGIDILVNNAGVVKPNKVIYEDIEALQDILNTNVLAMAIATQQAVASMRSRDVPGFIININSLFGHRIINLKHPRSLYPASKHAVTALTETVRRELLSEPNNKIKVTSISPGLVESEIRGSEGLSKTLPALNAKDIADGVLYVLGTRDEVQVAELTIQHIAETV